MHMLSPKAAQMNNIKKYIDNEENTKKRLEDRGCSSLLLDDWKNLYLNINKAKRELEMHQHDAKKISEKFKEAGVVERSVLSLKSKSLKEKVEILKRTLKTETAEFEKKALLIPNVPRGTVPYGEKEDNNVIIWEKGKAVKKNSPHWMLMEDLEIASEKGGVSLSGTRFIQYLPKGAELVRKLTDYLLEFQIKRGYKEVSLPFIVNKKTMINTGQLPNLAQDMYGVGTNQYLIPTGEVTLTNLHAEELLKKKTTLKYVTQSACFRRESGAAGRDNRGLVRIHQFNKVEIVKICHFSQKEKEFKDLQTSVEKVLDSLEIPYRKVHLCTGDLGFTSAETFDYEIWNSGVAKYREISSASIMEDFQSNRMKTRFLENDNSKTAAITMNASALAISRLIAAIIENNYDEELQKVKIPSVLVPYFKREYL